MAKTPGFKNTWLPISPATRRRGNHSSGRHVAGCPTAPAIWPSSPGGSGLAACSPRSARCGLEDRLVQGCGKRAPGVFRGCNATDRLRRRWPRFCCWRLVGTQISALIREDELALPNLNRLASLVLQRLGGAPADTIYSERLIKIERSSGRQSAVDP